MSAKYERMRDVSRDVFAEKNDCGVIALAIASGSTYKDAHAACARAGRKPRDGTTLPTLAMACHRLKTPVRAYESVTGHTIGKIAAKLPTGTYLLFTRGHVAAMIDGIVHDWTQGRRHRVIATLAIGDA